MKFTITYQRAMAGNDVDVQVDAEDKETIASVRCSLDGFEIGCDDLSDAPVVSFQGLSRKREMHDQVKRTSL